LHATFVRDVIEKGTDRDQLVNSEISAYTKLSAERYGVANMTEVRIRPSVKRNVERLMFGTRKPVLLY
jgi:hypothetical protein